jgi:hypothetical protein
MGDSCSTVAAHHASGVGRADARLGGTVRLLDPGASLNATYAVQEPDRFGQVGGVAGIDWAPLVA